MKVKKASGKPILARARRPLEIAADTRWRRFVKAVAARWKYIAVGVGAVALVTLGVTGYFWYRSDREKRAALAYAKISENAALRMEKAAKEAGATGAVDEKKLASQLIADLEEYIRRYGNTGPGKAATFELASLYYEQGNYKRARELFASLEKNNKSETARWLAAKGVADCDRAAGNLKAAVAKYEAVRRECGDRFPKVPLAMALADCYYRMGELDKAKEIYRAVVEDDKASPYAAEAAERLAKLYALIDAGKL